MTISILGIDIGKNSCSVVGVDERGSVILRRTMRRQTPGGICKQTAILRRRYGSLLRCPSLRADFC